jgi:hypothetical protein
MQSVLLHLEVADILHCLIRGELFCQFFGIELFGKRSAVQGRRQQNRGWEGEKMETGENILKKRQKIPEKGQHKNEDRTRKRRSE